MLNKDMKLAKSLHLKKFREEHGMFLVEGRKMVAEVLKAGWDVVGVFTTDEALAVEWNAEQISERIMESITAMHTPSPCLAIVRKREAVANHAHAKLILILDEISDPGNMGTLIRTAEWFGLQQIFLTAGCVEIYNPKVLQATMGSFFRMQYQRFSHDELIQKFAETHTFCVADLEGESLFDAALPVNSALIIGSESHGISPKFNHAASKRLHIPGNGEAESLNAAVAGAIVLSEFFRRNQL